MTPSEYNRSQLAYGAITWDDIERLVRYYQQDNGLTVDGRFGPVTRDLLLGDGPMSNIPILTIDADGWLRGPHVIKYPMHPTWHYASLGTPSKMPRAIVAHYTATDPGTALNMAKNRINKYRPRMPIHLDSDEGRLFDRPASWHVSIDTDTIVQMAPFTVGCWHVAGKPIPTLGNGNYVSVGIELVGRGKVFPDTQVTLAMAVWRALVKTCDIKRQFAMVQHSQLDPTRRGDPGPVWMKEHATRVLDYAYQP